MSDFSIVVDDIKYTVIDPANYTARVSADNDLSNNLNVTFITSYPFGDIVYPVNVISIDDSGFAETLLQSIVIPASVTEIGEEAFYGCTDLTSVTFESNTTLLFIGNNAFSGCTSLSSITLPVSVISLGVYVFQDCPLTNQSYNIPPGITVLPEGFFTSPILTNVILPPTITSVAANTFVGCTNLISVKLSDNITTLDWVAFSNCPNMKYLTIKTNIVLAGYTPGSGLDTQTGLGLPNSFIVLRGLDGNLGQTDLNSYISSLTNGTIYIYSGFTAPTTAGATIVTIPVLPSNKNNVLVFGSSGVSTNNYLSASFGSSNPNNVRQSNGSGMKPLVVVVEYPNKYAIIQ